VQFRVTTLRYRPKEAVPIEPKQQRHISTDGVKTTTGATGQPGAPAPKNKKKPKKRRSIIGMIFSFIGCMLCLCIMAASVGGVLLSMYIVQVTADDAETLDLDNQKNRQTSIVYDINGNEYASLSRNENRIWRELSAMPENLQNAVIAIEDKNFRTEPGINLKGTIGAALNAFTGNRIWGTNRGASTLEQQLIKNLTGDNEQDNMRKVREIFRALGLDNKYSKETILEAYLNTIPLTGIIHGMEAGSIEYFGKHVEDLTLAECATLASISKDNFFLCPKSSNKQGEEPMNDIFANTETMQENEHPRFYTAESVMRGHPDKLCDLIADSVLDACLQHDPASRVACEVMATHGHIIVAGEITTSAKPDVFNIVRDTLRDVGYDPKDYQIDCYIHDQSPDIAGAVEPELAEGEDEDTLGAGDQGVMVGYACNETPEYLPMPVVAAQRLVTLLEISRMTGVIPDIGPDGKVQVTMEYNGDTPVRITTVVVSVQHKEDTDINKLADLLDEYVFPLAFDGMPADDAEIILNPSGKFVQGGPDADTGLTGRKLMVDSYGTFAPHGGGAFSGKDATKVDRSGAYMARFIAKNIVAAGFAQRCQVTLAYAIGEKEPVMVDVNTFGTGGPCEDDCLSTAVRKAYDLTPTGIIKQLNLLNPMYSRTAAGGHFGREDFPWENVEHMSDLAAYIV